jgi:autotransporter-associated beta strand protein
VLESLEDRVVPSTSTYTWNATGGGSWTNPANWTPSSGASGSYPQLPGDVADLTSAITANSTITIPAGVTITVGTIVINSAHNYTIAAGGSGSNLTFDGGSGVAALTVDSNGSQAPTISVPMTLDGTLTATSGSAGLVTLSGAIGGTGGITKAGSGVIQLTNANTYAGATEVKAGTLRVTDPNALGQAGTDANGTTVDSGATLQLVNNSGSLTPFADEHLSLSGTGDPGLSPTGALRTSGTNGSGYILSGKITLQSGDVQIYADPGVGPDVTGQVTGSGKLQKWGTGTLILHNNSNDYSGGTVIHQGIVRADFANSLGAPAAGSVGVKVGSDGGGVFGGTLELEPNVNYNVGTSNPWKLQLSGPGVAGGVGALHGDGNTTWPGPIVLAVDPFDSSDNQTVMTVANNSTLTINGVIDDSTSGGGNSGTDLFIGQTTAQTGTVQFNAANTYTGKTTVAEGILTINNASALGTTGTGHGTFVDSGATLRLIGGLTFDAEPLTLNGTGFGSLAALQSADDGDVWTGNITLAANDTPSIGSFTGTTLTISGVIGGASAKGLIKEGNGTVVLTASNTFAGSTTISTGTIQLGNNTTTGNLSGGAITDNAALVFDRSDSPTDTNDISGTGSVTQAGSGTLTLAGTNSYSGTTTLAAGTLIAGNSSELGNGSSTNTLIFAGGSLQAGGTFTSPSTRGVTLNSTGLIGTNANSVSIAGVVSGSEGLTKNGSGTLTLSGSNTFGGSGKSVTVNGGTLSVAASNNLGNGGNTITLAGGTFQPTATFSTSRAISLGTGGGTIDLANGVTLTANGVVSGTGSLTKTSAGTLTLAGADTYSGNTQINGGTLQLTGSLTPASGTPTLTVNAGGTLAGTGTAHEAVAVAGGTVSPETNGGRGTLTVSSADFSAGGTLSIQVQGYTTPGTDYDRLAVANGTNGNLILGGTSKLQLDLTGLTTDGKASGIATYTGTRMGQFSSTTFVNLGTFTETTTYGAATNSAIDVSLDEPLTPVPNPGTVTIVEGSSTGPQTLATFTDANPGDHHGDFTATIHWADGSSDTGVPVTYNGRIYSVAGSHVYAQEGSYAVTVDVSDVYGSSLTGIGQTTVNVNDAAPVVKSNNMAVSAAENVPATNAGTWSDYDDTVLLSASAGVVVQNGDGTWTWSGTGDETSPYTVTITATNSHGSMGMASFTVSFTEVKPTIVSLTSPAVSAPENMPATNSGAFGEYDDPPLTITADKGNLTDNGDGTWTWSGTGDEKNPYTVTVTAENTDGTKATELFGVSFTDAAPTGSAAHAAVSAGENMPATNSGAFSEYDDPPLTITADHPGLMDNGDGTWTWSGTGDEKTPYTVTVTAKNADGTKAQTSFDVSFTDAAPVPQSLTSAAVSAPENMPATNSGAFNEYDDPPLTITADKGNLTDNGDGTWTWSGTGDDSSPYSVTVTATNQDGQIATESFAVSFTGVAPTLKVLPSAATAPENAVATTSGSFADYDSTLTITADHPGLTDNGTGRWSWSGTGDDSSPYTVTVTATNDDGLPATESFAVSFTGVAPTPKVLPSAAMAPENAVATTSGSFTDYDSTLTITADHPGLIDNGDGTWNWSGTGDDSSPYTVTVTATNDDGLTATESFAVSFSGVAPTPTILPSAATAPENTVATTSGSFTDYDSASTITADHPGLIDNGNGTWSWSGTGDDSSPYTVTVTATNDDGLTATESFAVSFSGVAPTVKVTPAVASAPENATASSSGSFADYDSTLTITADHPGLIDNGDGTWNWSGTGDDSSPYTVHVTASTDDGLTATESFAVAFTDVAPAVAANNSKVTGSAGGTVNNTGSFSDYDDPVTLTASAGKIVQTGTTSGTWSWSQLGLAQGTYTITITATNSDGSTASTPFTVIVNPSATYSFSGFLPPLNQNLAYGAGRSIPIKFQLYDAANNPVTSLSAVTSLQIQALDAHGNPVNAPFNPTPDGGTALRNDGSQYIFNWQTKGLAAGSYSIRLTLADGTTHSLTISITSSGKGANAQTIDSSDVIGGGSAGELLGGDVEVYVNDPNGLFSADELARLQDAISAVDAVVEPYGVSVTETTDPNAATVVIDTGDTSAVGGYADGILGCYTTAGEITMIQGWSWYTGSDPTGIGAGQYDFQTTVTHELGHALGLGESNDATSPMYATLPPATTHRTLSTNDLNLPPEEESADAQRAEVPPVPSTAGTPSAASIAPTILPAATPVARGTVAAVDAVAFVLIGVGGQSGLAALPRNGAAANAVTFGPVAPSDVSAPPSSLSPSFSVVSAVKLPGGSRDDFWMGWDGDGLRMGDEGSAAPNPVPEETPAPQPGATNQKAAPDSNEAEPSATPANAPSEVADVIDGFFADYGGAMKLDKTDE